MRLKVAWLPVTFSTSSIALLAMTLRPIFFPFAFCVFIPLTLDRRNTKTGLLDSPCPYQTDQPTTTAWILFR